MIKLSLRFAMPAFAFLVGLNCAAVAQDKLRIAGGLAGTWENSFSELGQNAGFFKKHGGPPTMPKDLRERIAADIRTVMNADPLINDRLIMTAQVPNPGGPAEFAKSIDEQRAVLTKAAKDLGITPK